MGNGQHRPKTGTAGLRGLLIVVPALMVAGCLGDPPPPASSAPVEVVIEGCELNRSEIAAGTHEVSVVGAGLVEIVDASGQVVLSVSSEDVGQGRLETTAQTYTIRCNPSSGVESSTELDSAPAGR